MIQYLVFALRSKGTKLKNGALLKRKGADRLAGSQLP